jgi:hypothetical protein
VELELIESTLDYYLDDESQRVLDETKELLNTRLESEAATAVVGSKARASLMQRAAEERASLLQQIKHSTAIMFSCFTSTKVRRKKVAPAASAKPVR